MADKSRYDELHDVYHEIQSTKKGTRYERLAAVVFASLERTDVVVHDLRLLGESGVEHQIDIRVKKGGKATRILIECKDFDISGKPVGLGVVRDFWGAVDDLHPDEAWILTCNDFTSDARKYAKSKGIRLATLRLFSEADWEGRVKTIVVNIDVEHPRRDKSDLKVNMSDADAALFARDMSMAQANELAHPNSDSSQIYDGQQTTSLRNIAADLLTTFKLGSGQTELVTFKECNGWISADGNARYKINGYRMTIPVERISQQLTISPLEGAARLLLSDGAGLDFVLWDETLRGYTVDESGQIHIAEPALQERLQTSVVSRQVP